MNYTHFIGIDVSKLWLDFAILSQGKIIFQTRVENSPQGIRSAIKRLKAQSDFQWQQSVFCMEHTGIYNHHLLGFFTHNRANLCLESGLQIKRSSGLKRGKSDKVDAERIAIYAFKNRDELKLWEPKREIINELKYFVTLRSRLINIQKQLKTPLKETAGFVSKKIQNQTMRLCSKTIRSAEKDLKSVEKKILDIINYDPILQRLFKVITSVVGIGPVTATGIIIATNEFKDISEAKKFACYSGVAPFEHQSGSSIRGKTRVSHLGNKAMKTLLHMSALVAANTDKELKIYYQRKVDEGKNKMLVLNAVRNKLILRIFSCVKNDRLYEKNININLHKP